MNDFEATLNQLVAEAADIQSRERQLKMDGELFSKKMFGFLSQNGLPENFTLPELALLAVKKSRELIRV